jgi:hypothetical protein
MSKTAKYLIQEKDNSLEISHPDFKINSIVEKKFITYNYIKSLQRDNESLKKNLEEIRGHLADLVWLFEQGATNKEISERISKI